MVQVVVGADDVDIVTDRLWQFGPEAVSEADADGGRVVLVAGFANRVPAAAAHASLQAFDAHLLPAPDDDWVSTWRAGETPHEVGPLVVRLPEHHPTGGLDVEIEPGATFGFSHESTLLALELLLAEAPVLGGARVADVGCGSGVLSIAAARLGAQRVDAVDIDPDAAQRTRANAARNGLGDVVEGTVGSVAELAGHDYDVIVANLLPHVQMDLALAMTDRLDGGGAMIVSGILAGDIERIVEAYAPLALVDRRSAGEWAALTLRR